MDCNARQSASQVVVSEVAVATEERKIKTMAFQEAQYGDACEDVHILQSHSRRMSGTASVSERLVS